MRGIKIGGYYINHNGELVQVVAKVDSDPGHYRTTEGVHRSSQIVREASAEEAAALRTRHRQQEQLIREFEALEQEPPASASE